MILEALDRVRFVLVDPQSAGNVGAAARALRNMGLSRLTVVGEVELGGLEARRMAMSAAPLLEATVRAGSLETALAGSSLTVATTRRAGKNRGPMVDIREAAGRGMQAALAGNQVAFVFGREDAGLTTAELDACHLLA
ncbi:MAG: RNA methyltransferase, partial [Acidobacteriota bacterium]